MHTALQEIDFVGGPFDGHVIALSQAGLHFAKVIRLPAQRHLSVTRGLDATANCRCVAHYELQERGGRTEYRYSGTRLNPNYRASRRARNSFGVFRRLGAVWQSLISRTALLARAPLRGMWANATFPGRSR